MRNRKRIRIVLLISLFFPLAGKTAQALGQPSCHGVPIRQMPPRPAAAPATTAFVRSLAGMDDDRRESAIRSELESGNVPPFLRQLTPVRLNGVSLSGQRLEVTLCVAPDYLAVGSDDDYLLVPLRLQTALEIATRYGFVLPTRKMVDAIYEQSAVHLKPQPLPAGDTMRSTEYYWRHNALVHMQRIALAAPIGALTAGDKKDLVITSRLWRNPQRVAIYGWHRPDGQPIQPLSTVHGERYADYSHGVRLISAMAYADGEARSITDLLQDAQYAAVLSDEGAIPRVSELVAVLSRQIANPLGLAGSVLGLKEP